MRVESDAGRRRGVAAWSALAAAGVLVASLAASTLAATPRTETSGDEPYYLITAISIAADGDLDVANQYAEQAYRPFHAPPLRSQGRKGQDGRIVEPHDPLLPALLAAPVAVGGWRAAQVVMALLAGATAALVVAALSSRLGVAARRSAAAVVVLLASAPFAVYGSQIYPEVPAALAVAAGITGLLGPRTAWRSGGVVAAVVALPWLSVKHVPVAAVLAIALLVRRWRAGRRSEAALVTAALAVAAAVYVVAHLAWYGGVTVYASGTFFAQHGGELSVLGTRPDLLGRTTRLVGLLVDRHFGLAAWQPAWLLLVPALAAFVRRRPPGWGVVTAVLATGWLNATFLAATMHGYWFPGRHVLAVLPAAVLVAVWWAAATPPRLRILVVAGGLGLVSYAALLLGAVDGDTTAVFFTGGRDPWRAVWSTVLPDYPRAAAVDWALHGGWVLLLGALAGIGWCTSCTDRTPGLAGA